MPNINLIALRRAEKKRIEQNTRRLFIGLAAEVAALVLLVSYCGARQIALRSALAEASAELQKLQPTLDLIAQIEKEAAVLKPKLDTLVSAKADTLRWRAMLQIVSQSIPSSTWLSAIASSGEGTDATITLTGTAGSQALVGETMTRLGSFPVFDKVDLRFTQMSTDATNTAQRVSFEIGAHLKSTRPAQKDDPESSAKQAAKGRTHGRKGGNNGKPHV